MKQEWKFFNLVLLFLLFITIIFSLFYGSVKVPIEDVIKILLNKVGNFDFPIEKKSFTSIVFYVRLPRILVAVLVGGALGISGCTMQSLLKNPIADSSIVGISSGASLGAVIAISFGLTNRYIFAMPIFSMTLSAQPEAPKLNLSSFRPASPNALSVVSVARVPLVYRC